jgi:hypothetical protein
VLAHPPLRHGAVTSLLSPHGRRNLPRGATRNLQVELDGGLLESGARRLPVGSMADRPERAIVPVWMASEYLQRFSMRISGERRGGGYR